MNKAYCTECKEETEHGLISLGLVKYWHCEDCGTHPEDEHGEVFTEDSFEILQAYARERSKERSGPVSGDVEILERLLEHREKLVEIKDDRQEADEHDCICQNFDLVLDPLDDLIKTVESKIEQRIEEFKGYLQEDDLEKCVREGYELAIQKLEGAACPV